GNPLLFPTKQKTENNEKCFPTKRNLSGLKFKDLLGRFQILLGVLSIGTYIPWLSWVDWLCGLEGKTNKLAKEIDEFLDGVIEDHVNKNKMADGNVDGGNDQSQYLVDILLDVQREDTPNFIFYRDTIKAVIMDVFPGGTDTTSTLLE
ncbi:cytochrome P450 71A4-like protein, partial [Tanacetum coccineum]